MTTPVQVYDRIYLKTKAWNRTLVVEYIDGYCDVHEKWLDEWRLIDLETGEVFERSQMPHDVFHVASVMYSKEFGEQKFEYIPEVNSKPELRKFDDLPLVDKVRHVQSHAQDLEHDFVLEGNKECPFAAALLDYQQRYNDEPCFYKTEDGKWEIYE